MLKAIYTDSPEGALKALAELCDPVIVTRLKDGIAAGTLEWIADPEHRHVWGVREMGERDPAKVRMVVYTDAGDFELDDEWWLA